MSNSNLRIAEWAIHKLSVEPSAETTAVIGNLIDQPLLSVWVGEHLDRTVGSYIEWQWSRYGKGWYRSQRRKDLFERWATGEREEAELTEAAHYLAANAGSKVGDIEPSVAIGVMAKIARNKKQTAKFRQSVLLSLTHAGARTDAVGPAFAALAEAVRTDPDGEVRRNAAWYIGFLIDPSTAYHRKPTALDRGQLETVAQLRDAEKDAGVRKELQGVLDKAK